MKYEELTKKLAKWRWPHSGSISVWSSTIDIAMENGAFLCIDGFTESLDALFKWIVPKTLAKIAFGLPKEQGIQGAYRILFDTWLWYILNETDELALALSRAVEKLIEKTE